MTRPLRLSVRARLTLIFVLVIIAPMAMTTLAGMRIQAGRVEQTLTERTRQALEDSEASLLRYARRAETIANHLARDGKVMNPQSQITALEHLEESKDLWFMGMVEVMDGNGQVLSRISSHAGDPDRYSTRPDDPILRRVLELEKVTDYFQRERGLVIKAATPIVDRATLAAIGAVVVTYPVDETFLRMLRDQVKSEITLQWSPAGWAVSTITEENGRTLSRIWPKALASFKDLKALRVQARETFADRTWTTAYAPLRSNDGETVAILATSSDIASIEKDGRDAIRFILISSGLAFLVAVALGLATAMTFTRPIYRLLKTIRFISQGHLESRVDLPRNDEIGDLALAFNEMAERLERNQAALMEAAEARERYARELEASYNALARFNQDLEQTVRQRTEELSSRNLALTREIEDRQHAETLLRESERRFMDIIQFLPDATFVIDRDGRVIAWNRAIEELTGVPAEDMLGKDDHEYSLPFYGERRKLLIDYVLNPDPTLERLYANTIRHGDDLRSEVSLPNFRDRAAYFWALATPLRDSTGQVVGAIESVRDITERVRAEQELVRHAFHDTLTGLPNRTLLMDRLELAVRRSMRNEEHLFALLLLDLDHFKLVNDTSGHLLGDQMLLAVAKRLLAAVRTTDTVARFGGDEFVVLLDEIAAPRETVQVASRLLKALDQPFPLDGQEVFTSASIGVVLGNGYLAAEDILRDADIAMYRAKELGRNRYKFFHSGLRRQAVKRMRLETDLRRAVDRCEFILHYQPIVQLSDGAVQGFEALVRWQHPTRGLLSPLEFIPKAEETGLILPLGRQILMQACAQMRDWLDRSEHRFPGLTVSVNLSGKQFGQPDIVEAIQHILAETGLSPARLRLEITESVVMSDAEKTVRKLRHLRDLGLAVVIDDFGTGYSSLSYLQRFPVTTLKVDKSFVHGIGGSEDNRRIIQAVVTLAHGLGQTVVAEGVETVEELEHVASLGCELAQGYYFSRPMLAGDAWTWLSSRSARISGRGRVIDINAAAR